MGKHPMPFLILTALLSAVLAGTCFIEGAVQNDAAVQQIMNAWKSRQQRVRSARFAIAETLTTGKGTRFGKTFPFSAPGGAQPLPSSDVTHELRLTLSFDGGAMHYTVDGPSWVIDEEIFLPRYYVSAFDGVASKAFYGESPGRTYPIGFVNSNNKSNQDANNYHIQAILITYRPLHDAMIGLRPEEWTLAGTKGVVKDRPCLIVEKASGPQRESYWVDPERDFSVLRFLRTIAGSVQFRLDVSYEHDGSHGWVPSAWNAVMLYPETGRLYESAVVRVTDYHINCPIELKDLQLIFPPNTLVEDYREDTGYIVREDMRKRFITLDERARGATYDQLLGTESGMAGLPETSWLRSWKVLTVGLVLLACIVGAVLRRTRVGRQPHR